jgi:hypothetical protein
VCVCVGPKNTQAFHALREAGRESRRAARGHGSFATEASKVIMVGAPAQASKQRRRRTHGFGRGHAISFSTIHFANRRDWRGLGCAGRASSS